MFLFPAHAWVSGAPVVTDITPPFFRDGDTVVITGTDFGPSECAEGVDLNSASDKSGTNVNQTTVSWSDTEITITIVEGTLGGAVWLFVCGQLIGAAAWLLASDGLAFRIERDDVGGGNFDWDVYAIFDDDIAAAGWAGSVATVTDASDNTTFMTLDVFGAIWEATDPYDPVCANCTETVDTPNGFTTVRFRETALTESTDPPASAIVTTTVVVRALGSTSCSSCITGGRDAVEYVNPPST
jgi:hypothetical protein